jgi:hypothetical protein
MADHRERLLQEYVFPSLKARARFPAVGRRWIAHTRERLQKALEEVNTRAEAVIAYQLSLLDPGNQEPVERIRWTALAVRLGTEVERWYTATEAALPYVHQRAALAWLLWSDSRGPGSARAFVEERLRTCTVEAESIYTCDGVDALRLLYEETQTSAWPGLSDLSARIAEPRSSAPGAQEAEGNTEVEDLSDGKQSASLDS